MPMPEFFRWEMDVSTNIQTRVDMTGYMLDGMPVAVENAKLFDNTETPGPEWRLMTDDDWDTMFPPEPVDPEPQE